MSHPDNWGFLEFNWEKKHSTGLFFFQLVDRWYHTRLETIVFLFLCENNKCELKYIICHTLTSHPDFNETIKK
jgi:hypothetical protein